MVLTGYIQAKKVFVSTSIYFFYKLSFESVLLPGVLYVLSGLMGFAGVQLIMTQLKIILSLILHFAIIGIFLYWSDLLNIIDIIFAVVWYVSAMGLSISSKKSQDFKKKLQ